MSHVAGRAAAPSRQGKVDHQLTDQEKAKKCVSFNIKHCGCEWREGQSRAQRAHHILPGLSKWIQEKDSQSNWNKEQLIKQDVHMLAEYSPGKYIYAPI